MSCRSFRSGNFTYTFSDDERTFTDARSECNRQGGTIASNIRQRVYRRLNNACTSTRPYWIGLVSRRRDGTNNRCPFRWVVGNQCINNRPLEVNRLNRTRCQAVAITLTSRNQRIPIANAHTCDTLLQYVCQVPFDRNRSTPSTPIFTVESTTSSVPANEMTTYFDESSGFEKIPDTTTTSTKTERTTTNVNTQSASSFPTTAVIAGSTAGLLFLLLLLTLFICWKIKKEKSQNSRTFSFKYIFSRTRNENNAVEDHVYCT